jgi:two-component system, chemotaxis family, protein-glutamate methylesterase/glutaminase
MKIDGKLYITKPEILRALVVDDTVLYRKTISDILSEISYVEVIGSAPNGKIAISKILSLKPDILTLDIEMPEMNGLEVLEWMAKETRDIDAIVLSTLTTRGGDMTMKALELGAFDFIPKPQSGNLNENREKLKKQLSLILNAYRRSTEIRRILGRGSKSDRINTIFSSRIPELQSKGTERVSSHIKSTISEIIAIGISTGGPKALAEMIPQIPDDIGVPILIVQHMPPLFTSSLASSLNTKCKITVKEANDCEPILPNVVYIAPGGKQMKIVTDRNYNKNIIRITDDPPENSCKPSADYLFRSIAQYYAGKATGVIMTGMGHDGNLGLQIMKKNGATIIAQDQQSCVVYGMPKGTIESGTADIIAPLGNIAREIYRTVKPESNYPRNKSSRF